MVIIKQTLVTEREKAAKIQGKVKKKSSTDFAPMMGTFCDLHKQLSEGTAIRGNGRPCKFGKKIREF